MTKILQSLRRDFFQLAGTGAIAMFLSASAAAQETDNPTTSFAQDTAIHRDINGLKSAIELKELQHKLHDLEAKDRASDDSSSDTPPPGKPDSSISGAPPAQLKVARPTIKSIRGHDTDLNPLIAMPDGTTFYVHKGTVLPDGLRVTNIDPSGVYVSSHRDGSDSFPLGFSPPVSAGPPTITATTLPPPRLGGQQAQPSSPATLPVPQSSSRDPIQPPPSLIASSPAPARASSQAAGPATVSAPK